MSFIPDKVMRIWKDHKAKSDMVRVLKKKLKNRISVNTLKGYLEWEKKHKVEIIHHMSWNDFDEIGYERALARQQARIDLLNELINLKERG